jgi:hypothetical protein
MVLGSSGTAAAYRKIAASVKAAADGDQQPASIAI